MKLIFPFCEHLRNFEFKYDLFRKYVSYLMAKKDSLLISNASQSKLDEILQP